MNYFKDYLVAIKDGNKELGIASDETIRIYTD